MISINDGVLTGLGNPIDLATGIIDARQASVIKEAVDEYTRSVRAMKIRMTELNQGYDYMVNQVESNGYAYQVDFTVTNAQRVATAVADVKARENNVVSVARALGLI